MNKLLNRIKSGPSLLVLLLITLSFYSSFTTKSHPQTTSLKKNFRPIRNLPAAVVDFESAATESESDDLEVDVNYVLPDSLKLVLFPIYRAILNNLDSFAFIKVPIFFFHSDIPPPSL